MRGLCSIVFAAFTFVYLYYYQADVLTAAQHVLSKGMTHYNHFVGAVVITACLVLLQCGVYRLCRHTGIALGLTFVPSALCLAALTDVSLDGAGGISFCGWGIGLPVALGVYAMVVWLVSQSGLGGILDTTGCVIRSLWVNLLAVLACAVGVCLIGNGDSNFHARMRAERLIVGADYDGALDAIKALGTSDDPNMTMLAAYALSRKGCMADHLFEYPISRGSSALIPSEAAGTSLVMYPDSLMYGYMGGWFKQPMSASHYFGFLLSHHRLKRHAVDYWLCSLLMDKRLDRFAADVGRFYTINDSLPRHYREALVLYKHRHASPLVVYSDNVTEADFQDFQSMQEKYPNPSERRTRLRDTYGNTYWYYYTY